MLFVLLLSFGKQTSVSIVLLLALLVVDYHQWLGLPWRRSVGRAVATGIRIGVIYVSVIILISVFVVGLAFLT